MKTLKELADIGAKAAGLLNKVCAIAITRNHPGWYHDEDSVLLICITLLIILFDGKPDIADAIIYTLTNGKLVTP